MIMYFNFAFAGEELDRAHFAHIHADRVGGAPEFGVQRGGCGLGGFLVDVISGGGRRRLRHQQRFGIGRLVVDLDPHVVDHGDDAFDLLGVENVVRQVIVDFGVSEVAALLAEHDQILQPGLACFCLGRRQLELAQFDAAVLAAAHFAFGERFFSPLGGQPGRDFTRRRLDRSRSRDGHLAPFAIRFRCSFRRHFRCKGDGLERDSLGRRRNRLGRSLSRHAA